jgi:enediyne biosynthesis thioesterase
MAHGLRLVTARCACEFYLELAVFDELEIRMTLERLEQNRLALAFDYVRTSSGYDELVARGSQEIAFLRAGAGGGMEATRPPDALLAALTPYAAA